MEIQVAVAKVNKYGSIESGDTIEFVERPMGGISVVLADARSSGKKAKAISSLVVRKIISLLAEGVRMVRVLEPPPIIFLLKRTALQLPI